MTPGLYLRKRREAAGLSLGEVARQIATIQLGLVRLDRRNLLEQLERVEGDEAALTLAQAQVLRNVFAFDPHLYMRLLARGTLPLTQICRACACSWFDPCLPDSGARGEKAAACSWAEPDLCSACAERPSRVSIDAIPIQLSHQGAC
ncbi:helix-turn-helix domain-containing protein [Qipengyuania sp.]|uniref:helix-turn-helix domain-containing protein n=1 Tax=Qipengyuania sp. TaxID=2004515 RepID=UPI00351251CF